MLQNEYTIGRNNTHTQQQQRKKSRQAEGNRERERKKNKNQFCLTLVKRMASLLNIHWSYNPSLSCSVVLLDTWWWWWWYGRYWYFSYYVAIAATVCILFYLPYYSQFFLSMLALSLSLHPSFDTLCDVLLICCSRLSIPCTQKTAIMWSGEPLSVLITAVCNGLNAMNNTGIARI